jgi:[acyl-carrier-protein] S-malonyltransferase
LSRDVPKVALLFPGQGAQALGMGRGLADRSEIARDLYDRASALLGYDLLKLCETGPVEQLNLTSIAQPALFVHSAAALECLAAERGSDSPTKSAFAVAGLSLGEYSALYAAGVLDFESGLKVVMERGLAMQEAAEREQSGMVSVLGLDAEKLQAVCDEARRPNEILQMANYLCPGNIAISGHAASLEAVEPIAMSAGAMRIVRLAVAGAFHTDLMLPAVERLKNVLADCPMKKALIPLFSNVDASPHEEPVEFRDLLSKQVISPVKWEETLKKLIALGVEEFYEIGAGRVLAGTLKRIDRKIVCHNYGD